MKYEVICKVHDEFNLNMSFEFETKGKNRKVLRAAIKKELINFLKENDNCYGKVTNIELIQITQAELDGAIGGIGVGIERILMLKSGELTPERCGKCDYCKETKVITRPISMSSLLDD